MATNFKEAELLEFIDKKVNDVSTVNERKIFFVFIKILCNTLYSSYVKLSNVQLSLSCSEMIFSIFWIIFKYTLNLKLSMFLCERGVILFVEYINLSSDLEDGVDKINMMDVKLFIYKKTLGPLMLGKSPCPDVLSNIHHLTLTMKHFIQSMFVAHASSANINTKLECVCSNLGATVFKMHQVRPSVTRSFISPADYPILVVQTNEEVSLKDFKQSILLLKLKLEIVYYGFSTSARVDLWDEIIKQVQVLHGVQFPGCVLDGSSRLVETPFFNTFVKNFYLRE